MTLRRPTLSGRRVFPLVACCLGLWAGTSSVRATVASYVNFTDAFPGTTLSSTYWGTQGGDTGSTTTVNNKLVLTTATSGYSKRWIQAGNSNYSYVSSTQTNSTQTYTIKYAGMTNVAATSSIRVCLVSTTGTSGGDLTGEAPSYSSPNALELRFAINSAGTAGTLSFSTKLNTSNADPTPQVSIGSLSTTAAATMSLTLTNSGLSNPTMATIAYTTSAGVVTTQSYILPSTFNSNFNATTYLYLEATSDNNGVANAVTLNSFSATGFGDNFTSPTANLSPLYWNTTSYAGTGYGGGDSGSSTTVSGGVLSLLTSAATNKHRWISAAGTNYSYIGNTLTAQAVVKSYASSIAVGSGVSIYLVGADSSTTTAELTSDDPVWSCPNVIELRFVATTTGGVPNITIRGKYASANADTGNLGNFPIIGGAAVGDNSEAITNGSMIGFSINNSGGLSSSSTLTLFSGPGTGPGATNHGAFRQNFTLPSSYNTAFSGPVYFYIASATGSTTASTSTFTNASITVQPVQQALVQVAATTTKQTLLGLGGDYAKNRAGNASYVDDTCGTYNLSHLSPGYVRIGVPLNLWEPVSQTVNGTTIAGLIAQPSGYFAEQDVNNATNGTYMHNIFLLIQACLTQNSNMKFIFSTWDYPSYMLDSNGELGNSSTSRAAYTNAMGAFLLYAKANYGLNLGNVYLSVNEPDNLISSPASYAQTIADAQLTYFPALGITNTISWIAGEDECLQGWLLGSPYNWQVGAVEWNQYEGSYAYRCLQDLQTDESLTNLNGKVVLGAHSWDEQLSPTCLGYLSAEGAAFNNLPIIIDEVGYNYAEAYDPNMEYATFVNSWDNAWKDANAYQKVLNYGGACINLYWEYMQDSPLVNNTTGVPYSAYYPMSQLVSTFTSGTTILGSTTNGFVEAMAGGSSGSASMVEVIQNDDRPVTVGFTGLLASHTYNVTQSSYNQNAASWSSTVTSDSSGNLILPIPAAPIESVTTSNSVAYSDSGSVVMLH